MPPGGSQAGTGKKGGVGGGRGPPRSRNTTPSVTAEPPTAPLPPVETHDTEYLELSFELFRNITYEDLVDTSASNAVIPDSRSLDGIVNRIQHLQEIIERRGTGCDRGMRELASTRKRRMDELAERGREEERRAREAAADEERERRANKKKRKATENLSASQETNLERSSPLRESSTAKGRKLSRDNDSVSSSLSPPAQATPKEMELDDKPKVEEKDEDDESSSEEEAGPPAPAAPQFQTFGDDPSTFPDPTVYEVLPVEPGMTEEELKKIYSVAVFPKSNLADLIAGDPPDKDFSSAKPSNQINFTTFSAYIEPYFRTYTEEDLAFLRERGDRVGPFVMPKRGKRHYTEMWAEEDGAMAVDSAAGRDRLPPNHPRGNIDNMDEDVAETDKLSVGPLLSRLLSALRPENRAPPSEDKPAHGGVNGEVNGDGVNGDFSFSADNNAVNGNGNAESQTLPPATLMPECNSEAWKKATHPKLDYSQVDERIKQELRHIGFLPLLDSGNPNNPPPPDPATTADYDGHFDDEVAARLRLLQARLREQVLVNGARKARLADLVRERMAHQEYQTILEDLDSQVQAAYLKRTRTMGKHKHKKARPGPVPGAGGAAGAAGPPGSTAPAGMARPGIGDLTKMLMERRRRWIDNIGTVFDDENVSRVPRVSDPGSSIFKPVEMADLLKKEKENWDDEVEEE